MHTSIPDEELEVFKSLDIQGVVVDVGAREDIDMYHVKPQCEYHLFEPSTEFFRALEEKTAGISNIHINNCGLAQRKGDGFYDIKQQSFLNYQTGGYPQKLSTLDEYCEENGIDSIEFLKIDTEGYDYRVLVGAERMLERTKYIQFEYWDGVQKFHDALCEDFDMFLMMEPVLREAVFRGFDQNEAVLTIFKETLIPLEEWLIHVIDTALIPDGYGGNILCIRR